MAKYLVCIETDTVLGKEVTPEQILALKGKVIAVYDKLNHEDDFIKYHEYSEDCIKLIVGNKENLKYIFHEIFEVFIQNGLISPEGKFQLEGYEVGSYVSYALRMAQQYYDYRVIQETEIRANIVEKEKQNKELKKLETFEENEEVQALYNENLAYINEKRLFLSDFGLYVKGILTSANFIGNRFKIHEKKPFNFDYTQIQHKVKPSGEKLMAVVISLLKDDPEFQKVMQGIQSVTETPPENEH
jgi:hypothetical protein